MSVVSFSIYSLLTSGDFRFEYSGTEFHPFFGFSPHFCCPTRKLRRSWFTFPSLDCQPHVRNILPPMWRTLLGAQSWLTWKSKFYLLYLLKFMFFRPSPACQKYSYFNFALSPTPRRDCVSPLLSPWPLWETLSYE